MLPHGRDPKGSFSISKKIAGMNYQTSSDDLEVKRAYERLTAMQALVAEILGRFVHRPLEEVPAAIDDAIAKLGAFCGVDRTYVFEMLPGDLMSNTHEWCADGISPEIDTLQNLPTSSIHFWLEPLASGEPVEVPHIKALPDSRRIERELLDRQGIQSLLVVPMLNGGELFGFVGFDSVRDRRGFTEGERSLLTSVADVICSALVRREAAQQVSDVQARLAAITDHTSDLVMVLDTDGRISWASPAVERLLEKPMEGESWWTVVDEEQKEMLQEAANALLVGKGEGAGGNLPDCRIQTPQGKRWLATHIVDLKQNPAVNGVVVTARDITDRRKAEEKITHQATHDMLTGLPNRFLLSDRLLNAAQRAKRHGHAIGLLYLDIDHFKLVNDGHGHSFGDELLKEVAGRISDCVRSTDTVSRFGGDEFVILLDEIRNADDLDRVADNIIARIAAPIRLEGQQFFVTVSIGVLMHDGHDFELEKVLQNADAAMYSAKKRGRSRVAKFSSDIQHETENQARIAHKLRKAIKEEAIFPVFQPIYRLDTQELVGYEALARWIDAELGVIAPGSFIEIAEQTGQIRPLGLSILEQALEAAAQASGTWLLNINISPRQLDECFLEHSIAEALAESGFPAHRLCLEMTENTIANQSEETMTMLHDLKARGVRLAIDDFGTGYSSFGILRSIPFDFLKIDQSFIAGLSRRGPDSRLVRAFLGLASDLGLDVIAEGIETSEQEHILRELGCRLGQGYLFGKPGELAAGTNSK